MMVPVPAIHWPREFHEQGPDADPVILLIVQATIAGKPFKVGALRMRPAGREPDFRQNVAEEEYAMSLESVIEDIEDLVESIQPPLITMNGGSYLLWMVPQASP